METPVLEMAISEAGVGDGDSERPVGGRLHRPSTPAEIDTPASASSFVCASGSPSAPAPPPPLIGTRLPSPRARP